MLALRPDVSRVALGEIQLHLKAKRQCIGSEVSNKMYSNYAVIHDTKSPWNNNQLLLSMLNLLAVFTACHKCLVDCIIYV